MALEGRELFSPILEKEEAVVRAVGVEPTLCYQNQILSLARLPIPPRPQAGAHLQSTIGKTGSPPRLHGAGSSDLALALSRHNARGG